MWEVKLYVRLHSLALQLRTEGGTELTLCYGNILRAR